MVVGWALSIALVATGASGAGPSGDLLIWNADVPETLWLRDGRIAARRGEVVVAAGQTLWALRLIPREVTVGNCTDGWEDEDRAAPKARTAPKETIRDLVASPLQGGVPLRLASEVEGDDAPCGAIGTAPELLGGVESRVSLIWDTASTTTAAITDDGRVGKVFDLATRTSHELSPDPRLLARAKKLLALRCDGQDPLDLEECRQASPTIRIVALRVGIRGGRVGTAAVAIRDRDGNILGNETDLPLSANDTLGVGVIPPAVIKAAGKTWQDCRAFGFSHAPGSPAERDALLAAFGAP